jgi:hypothetical protein
MTAILQGSPAARSQALFVTVSCEEEKEPALLLFCHFVLGIYIEALDHTADEFCLMLLHDIDVFQHRLSHHEVVGGPLFKLSIPVDQCHQIRERLSLIGQKPLYGSDGRKNFTVLVATEQPYEFRKATTSSLVQRDLHKNGAKDWY